MSKYLITGDWHLRSDTPICRTDSFMEKQSECLNEVAFLARKYRVDAIINAGDTFHRPRPDHYQELEIMLYEIFKDITIYFIAGNHELLYHRVETINECSIGVIGKYKNWMNRIQKISGDVCIDLFNFSQNIKCPPYSASFFNIAVIHKFVAEKKVPFFIRDGIRAQVLLNENPDYNLIITGDNHHGFYYALADGKQIRFVINPGCLNRQAADMKSYKPRCYIFDTETSHYDKIFLLDNRLEDVTEEHLIKNEERDERITAFVESLKTNRNISLSFEDNLKKFMEDNDLEKETENILLELMGT